MSYLLFLVLGSLFLVLGLACGTSGTCETCGTLNNLNNLNNIEQLLINIRRNFDKKRIVGL